MIKLIFSELFKCITFLLHYLEYYVRFIYTLILVTVSFKTNNNKKSSNIDIIVLKFKFHLPWAYIVIIFHGACLILQSF